MKQQKTPLTVDELENIIVAALDLFEASGRTELTQDEVQAYRWIDKAIEGKAMRLQFAKLPKAKLQYWTTMLLTPFRRMMDPDPAHVEYRNYDLAATVRRRQRTENKPVGYTPTEGKVPLNNLDVQDKQELLTRCLETARRLVREMDCCGGRPQTDDFERFLKSRRQRAAQRRRRAMENERRGSGSTIYDQMFPPAIWGPLEESLSNNN